MTKTQEFYFWWTNKVHGNYIENKEFDLILQKFEATKNQVNDDRKIS